MGVSPAELALGKALGQIPTLQWPIRLTTKTPYHLGIAALVFANATLLSPADDLAEFGSAIPDQQLASETGWFYPPSDGASVVAWVRPPELGRKYSIDFSCEAAQGEPFTLTSSDGNTETVDVQQAPGNARYPTMTTDISSTFAATDHAWRWFALSRIAGESGPYPDYWRFSNCEFSPLS
jgi:hypothetical protein